MDNKYFLKNALVLNTTGFEYHAEAMKISLSEIKLHQHHFEFDFAVLAKQGKTVYKICKLNEPDIIQGLIAFSPSKGVLECFNMEAALINKKPIFMHNNIGKLMVALCCKISIDKGLEGYITFEAKNYLMNYYRRLGAVNIFGLRMAINNIAAKKLVSYISRN